MTLSLSTLQLQDLQLNLEREIQEKELLQAKNFKLKNELAEHERLKKLLKKLELAKDKLQREYDEYKVSTPAIVNVAWWDWMLVHCLGSLEEQSITLSSLCSIILQLLVCQRDCIDIEKFLGIILFVFFVGCMHLRMLVGSIALYFTAFDDFSLSVKHLWNIEPLWNYFTVYISCSMNI